jgi:RNA polymerase sigma-70 factor (ECF subfamily)
MGEPYMVRRVEAVADDDELLALYDAQVGDVFAFLLRRCGDIELAEDLTQETFVAAARLFRDTSEAPAPAWLYQVARSRLIDHWRREARRARKLRLLGSGQAEEVAADPANSVVSGRRVMAALDELPNDQRAVLVLRYLEGHSVSQIGESLGRSTKAAESILARARQNFGRSYEEQDGE